MDAEVRQLPVGRILAVDERGIGMRCTWHLERGFVNMSLWRDDTCVETFHLTPTDAAKLASFLVTGMAVALETPMWSTVEPAPAPAPPRWWVRLRHTIAKRLAA